jgi:hypothetical protein
MAYSSTVHQFRLNAGDISYDSESVYYNRLSSTLTRAMDLLKAWTNNSNDFMKFYAARGLWGLERDLAARTLKKLIRSKDAEVVRRVKNLIEDWGME